MSLCYVIISVHPTQVENASNSLGGYAISTLTVFGYSFLVATFILFLVQEKEIKVKTTE